MGIRRGSYETYCINDIFTAYRTVCFPGASAFADIEADENIVFDVKEYLQENEDENGTFYPTHEIAVMADLYTASDAVYDNIKCR